MNPLISIIIPTRNRAHLIEDTLESVLNQSYSHWECIVIDDGSSDNTAEIVSAFNDERIKYFYQDHGERSKARNYGLSLAKGDFIQFLDSDDILKSNKLKISIENLEKMQPSSKRIGITDFEIFYSTSAETFDPYCRLGQDILNFRRILFDWDSSFTIPIHCGLFDKQLLKNFQFPENLSSKEDWFLWLYIFQQENLSISFIEEALVLYRFREHKKDVKVSEIYRNEDKVLEYLKTQISREDVVNYYLHLIKKKNLTIKQLQTSTFNYKKTRTYRISQWLKELLNIK